MGLDFEGRGSAFANILKDYTNRVENSTRQGEKKIIKIRLLTMVFMIYIYAFLLINIYLFASTDYLEFKSVTYPSIFVHGFIFLNIILVFVILLKCINDFVSYRYHIEELSGLLHVYYDLIQQSSQTSEQGNFSDENKLVVKVLVMEATIVFYRAKRLTSRRGLPKILGLKVYKEDLYKKDLFL